jgi:hypothetical protein
MPLEVPPPRSNRFGSPLVLSRVHWVRPELVVEVKFLTWTDDNLLRQVVYEGLREDKPAIEVRRSPPHPVAPNITPDAAAHRPRPQKRVGAARPRSNCPFIAGVARFTNTHGLPLEVVLENFRQRGLVAEVPRRLPTASGHLSLAARRLAGRSGFRFASS